MNRYISGLLSTAAATVCGAVIAVVLMLGVNNGTFESLYTGIAKQLGLPVAQTVTVRPVTSYQISGSTGAASGSDATTTSADISSVTANWAGYVASGSNYTAISSSWTVPSVSAAAANQSADATWIGIGGSSSNDLIQIGTENLIENGQDQLMPFYEELPDYAQMITSVRLSPGDMVRATIDETTTGTWSLTLRDMSDGQAFSTTVDYDSSNSSAEWIQEAPSSNSGIMALDNFGSVVFSDASATVNGASESIAASGAQAITMENGAAQQLTTVSPLSAGGDGFTVTRTDASSSVATSSGRTRRHEPGINRFD